MITITFLRLLIIITFVHYNVFPWWIWLWAIICEFDIMIYNFYVWANLNKEKDDLPS
jgi:hypothetical protein